MYFLPDKTNGRKILSFNVNVSNKLKSWNTNPKLFLRNAEISFSFIDTIFFPFSKTSPLVGLSSEANILSRVVLPEPDSPIIATYSPSSTEKDTSDKA